MLFRRAKVALLLILSLVLFDVRCLMACAQGAQPPKVAQSEQNLPPCHRKQAPAQSEHKHDDCSCIREGSLGRERVLAIAPDFHQSDFVILPASLVDVSLWPLSTGYSEAPPGPPLRIRTSAPSILRI